MNNILDDVEGLKGLIINSKEYKEYDYNLKKIEKNIVINELIDKIKKLQKEVVRTNNKELEKELKVLFNELNSNREYIEYINSSKRLNILITNVQQKFQEYFDSLVS